MQSSVARRRMIIPTLICTACPLPRDNDLVPIDATPAERDSIVRSFKKACDEAGLKVPMATVNLFYDPVFRDGAFTSNDAGVRAYSVQKTMRAMDIGAELGAKVFVLWGGREGVETDACRRPDEAIKRFREAAHNRHSSWRTMRRVVSGLVSGQWSEGGRQKKKNVLGKATKTRYSSAIEL